MRRKPRFYYVYVHKSSKNGEFVTKGYAWANPDHTFKLRVRKRRK